MGEDVVRHAIDTLMKEGVNKVEFDWQGCKVTAYWVNSTLRMDIKGLR